MNSSKDLFELFRENETVLHERPAKRNWRRIERRLDMAQNRNRHSLGTRKSALLGSALVLTLTFAGLSTLHLYRQSPLRLKKTAFIVETMAPAPVDPATGTFLEVGRALQVPSAHIPEGEPGQELIVRP